MTLLVSLITPYVGNDDPISRRVTAQWRFFHARGDQAVIYAGQPAQVADIAVQVVTPEQLSQRPEHFAATDLFVFHAAATYPLLEMIGRLERGAVILYFHASELATTTDPSNRLSRYAAYADLVVAEGQAADLFVQQHGYTALPVHVLAVDANTTPEEYAIDWAEAVASATAWLPNRPYPYGQLPALTTLHPPADSRSASPSARSSQTRADDSLLEADLQQLLTSAKTMQRDYVVRSRLPLIGPLLAWLRRNLTSHLREPYIDPTFQRQEAFNRLAVQTVAQLAERIAQLELQAQERSDATKPPIE